MSKFKPTPSSIAAICQYFLLIFLCYLGYHLYQSANAHQKRKYDYAELIHAKHGLFNSTQWKKGIGGIIAGKIAETDLSPQGGLLNKAFIEELLYELIKELETYSRQREASGLEDWLKGQAIGFAIDFTDLETRVPSIAEGIIEELSDPETQTYLKERLSDKVLELVDNELPMGDTMSTDSRVAIIQGYQQDSLDETIIFLEKELQEAYANISITTLVMIGISLLIFLIPSLPKCRKSYCLWPIIPTSFLLLAGGLSLPMMDLDARIVELSFTLIGESLNFNNQLLFFQSKSILELFLLLMSQGSWETMVVGSLLFCFSVLFPLSKLMVSIWVFAKRTLPAPSSLGDFLFARSAKWSMADVLVVAIFMAYLGFRGIFADQLGTLASSNQDLGVITTHDFTSLQAGFYFFFAFSLGNLFISSIVKKSLNLDT